jgi:hypothetical protein
MTTKTTPERKWALRKLTSGDYVLPSNDETKLWRIVKGEAFANDDGSFKDGWILYRFDGHFDGFFYPEMTDFDRWEHWGSVVTRNEAIAEAMRAER